MAQLIRANDQGHIALGVGYASRLFSLYRDAEGVIHLRPLEEPPVTTPPVKE